MKIGPKYQRGYMGPSEPSPTSFGLWLILVVAIVLFIVNYFDIPSPK